ncbi:MAG TPA: DEAD/DEAH box helicase [Acholeplasmataceae bacterium]|nr:DEAD/DEAH box helicase [Acholeplasmataceae bacterium]
MKFIDLKLKEFINLGLKEIGFFELTPMQEEVIPLALKGEQIIGTSQTGTGKTHAFLIPILEKLNIDLKEVQSVIITPTRELGYQIYEELVKLIKFSKQPIDVRLYVGGSDRESEITRLEKSQPQIVIGTIGKIKDLAKDNNLLKIYTAKTVVIDEADMVFEQDEIIEIDNIFSLFSKQIQILLFSATISQTLVKFINKYLEKSIFIDLTDKEISKSSIDHKFIAVKNKDKNKVLLDLLSTFSPYLVLIFANTVDRVKSLNNFLGENGYKVIMLTGDLEARERKQVLRRIKNGDYQYVVASDIAARGIDITGVSHVINYELPEEIEFYIHRTGRTARYDSSGIAYTLYEFDDDNYIRKLRAKGLEIAFFDVKKGVITPAKAKFRKRPNKYLKEEDLLHIKYPVPKTVKPGYKKKRKEMIEKEARKIKRARISEIYKKRARKDK